MKWCILSTVLCICIDILLSEIVMEPNNKSDTSHKTASDISERLQKVRVEWNEILREQSKGINIEKLLQGYHAPERFRLPGGGGSIQDINDRLPSSRSLYQGDIMLTPEQASLLFGNDTDPKIVRIWRQAFRGAKYPANIWGRTVYYYFDENATPQIKTAFTRATQIWQENTCIDFVENATAANRIRVFKENGCWSRLGKVGGVQDLSLGPGCDQYAYVAVHELGHALGFFHTHSREDRDDFITINADAIDPKWVDQFIKQTADTNFNYDMTYDYGSVMHYGGLSASADGTTPTMIAHDIDYQDTMGSLKLGFYDIEMMNKHYGCDADCGENSPPCANGGFNNPRNCISCICPSGYGGQFCTERPEGCGAVLPAVADWWAISDSLGEGDTFKLEPVKCTYWIVAPSCSRIEIRIGAISGIRYVDGCYFGGVEIKTHEDVKRTGYLVCSDVGVNKPFVSSSNIVPVITYNSYGSQTIDIHYRIYPEN